MGAEREDKRTLGVTAEGALLLEALMGTGWFEEEQDAYRVAISVAFANEISKTMTTTPENRIR